MIRLSPELRKEIRGTVRSFRAWWPEGDPFNNPKSFMGAAHALELIEVGVVLVKDELRIDAGTEEEMFRYNASVDAMEAGCIAVFERDQ